MSVRIDRGFRRIDAGLVHHREAGEATDEPALVLLHGGPGSSAGLVPLIGQLAGDRRLLAPDLMGNGDSDPPPVQPTGIAWYAERILDWLDAIGLDRVDLYGHHSGAQIACEIAIAQPARVRRLVLDGVALFTPGQRAEFGERYAPPIVPDDAGGHLAWAWEFARNLTRYFPHYRRDDAHRIVPGLALPPEAAMRIVADLLKVWPTYHLLYEAAFAHDLAARLPLVRAPTLLLEIAGDPLARYAAPAGELLSECRIAPASRENRAAAIAAFLAA